MTATSKIGSEYCEILLNIQLPDNPGKNIQYCEIFKIGQYSENDENFTMDGNRILQIMMQAWKQFCS